MTNIEATIDAPNTATSGVTKTAAKKPAQQTDYTVLKLQDRPGETRELWSLAKLEEVVARSAEEAIRTGSDGEAGTYIAIPTRSWKRVKVTVEKIERVKLEDA